MWGRERSFTLGYLELTAPNLRVFFAVPILKLTSVSQYQFRSGICSVDVAVWSSFANSASLGVEALFNFYFSTFFHEKTKIGFCRSLPPSRRSLPLRHWDNH
jgi:hypothetical protein